MAEEGGVVSFLDMVLVPKTGLAHPLPIAGMPEPTDAWRIERLLVEIAKKRDRIAFDVATKAFPTGLVIDGKPEKRHRANHLTHFAFEGSLAHAHVSRRVAAMAPARKS